MIEEKELRVLSALESAKTRQELTAELAYQETTVSDALGGLEKRGLITRERKGSKSIAKPSDARCVEVFQSLTASHPHVDFSDLLTASMLNMLYYLGADDSSTATELTERTGHGRATIYRNLRTLTNRAMVTKDRSHYQLRDEFAELHIFATALQHHIHRVQIAREIEAGTIVWESHKEFLVRTDTEVLEPNYHQTGLDAFVEYGLQFFTTSEQYYFYSEQKDSLNPEDLFCHLLLIENDSRHRKYALLLAAETGLSEETLQVTAEYYGIEDLVLSLAEFLKTRGGIESETTPEWEEFESLAAEYEVTV
jgi:DNA-binding MarR family transcriptional regulator